MRLPNDTSKYSHQWKYYEAGRYMVIDGVSQIVRQGKGKKGERIPKIYSVEELDKFAVDYHQEGIYTSVYAYNDRDLDKATRLAPLFFDIDSANLAESLEDARKLVEFFNDLIDTEAIRIYFSGKKGFHIQIEPLAMGISPAKDLKTVFRKIAEYLKETLGLKGLDFAVYDHRRMWRKPYSRHQGTHLYKTPIPQTLLFSNNAMDKIIDLAKTEPKREIIPEQKLNIRAAAWYKRFVYEVEKEEQNKGLSIFDRLNMLNQQGSKVIHSFNTDDMMFDPVRLFENCPSIMRLWSKAEKTRNLDHEERLFLCSLLTYNQEAIDYLYSILQNCDDFDYNRSRHHIDDWIARRESGIGGRPYSCKTANENKVGCGDCDLQPKKKYTNIGGAVVETGQLAEPSPIRFAYKRKEKK